MKKILFFIVAILLSLIHVQALTGQSQSYSVSMFGNGVNTGTAGSTNYQANFLSDSTGTTSNVESPNFRGSLGFFENTGYFSSVNILSYSVNPSSVTVGSTVSFFISANNADQVWARITPPNSQEYTLNLINEQSVSHLPIPSVVGVYQVVFYAQSSSGSIASVVSSFELTAQISGNSGTGSGGSGGGTSTVIERCTYNWDCTPWSVCSNGIQTRQCLNIGTCFGNENKPSEQTPCSEALFDISLNLNEISISNELVRFNVDLIEKIGVENIDVHLKYSIINSKNEEIFSQVETRAVRGSLSFEKLLEEFSLTDGDYKLRVDVLYGNLQRAFAEQTFRISNGVGITGFAGEDREVGSNINYNLVLILFLVLVCGLLIYLMAKRKNLVRNITKKNSVVGLEGLDVYTDSGLKIGRVYDVLLQENKLYGLKVIVDKDAGIKYPKVLIRYQYVQNIKDAVIVSSVVTDEGNHHNA